MARVNKCDRDEDDVSISLLASNLTRLHIELHPLLFPEIISRVFSYCAATDLKHCRIVGSKVWLEESLHFWREKTVLKINNQTNYRKTGINMTHLQKIYQHENKFQFQGKPFQNLKLEGFFNLDGINPKWTWIHEKFSGNLSHLTFAKCQFSSLKGFMDIIFSQLPNLTELKLMDSITIHGYAHGQRQEQFSSDYGQHLKLKTVTIIFPLVPVLQKVGRAPAIPWKTLFSKIANLETLQIRSKYQNTAEEVQHVLRDIELIRRESRSELNLKTLELPSASFVDLGYGAPVDFATLIPTSITDPMPLEQLTAPIIDLVSLKPYSMTLEFLNVIFTKKDENANGSIDNVSDISDEKVSLPHLKELHATGTASRVFKNLNKVEATNLETLLVNDVPRVAHSTCWTSFDMIKLDNPSFGNVTKFECYVNSCYTERYTFDVEDFKQIAVCMPKMLHGKMPLTGEAFTEMCRMWPNIISLTILRSFVVKQGDVGDEALIGFRYRPDQNPVEESATLPNITDLKYLTDFVNPYELTEASVHFGFLRMPRLHYLNVKFKQISEGGISAIQKKVNILEIE